MEEEDYDNNSNVGQLIQHVNKLCKKPQIDNQLSDALAAFQENVTNQRVYLNNGIFSINFAEVALFLQSCTELYGKRIDVFWDQLLEFHTRLIEYDCRDDQEKGKKLDQSVIKQLEERRNRYKRKKKFKLALAEANTDVDNFLFDETPVEESQLAFEPDDNINRIWKRWENESAEINRIPKAVYKQQATMYRMKNYHILKSEDYDIYDPDDGEFNTKYSRIPGWHMIEHIFEYNTLGILPDKRNTIATLRLCCYLRAQFMRDRNIPFNAPYSQYKDEYLAFKKKFFEEEAKKWQNMPLDTMADLHRQLEYLAQKEREEDEKEKLKKDIPTTLWDIPPFMPKKACGIENCSDCSEDSKSSIITISDSLDKDFDTSLLKEDIAKTEAYVSLEKLSSDIVDLKSRQDSGVFDLDDTENLMDTTNENSQLNITDPNKSQDGSAEGMENNVITATTLNADITMDTTKDSSEVNTLESAQVDKNLESAENVNDSGLTMDKSNDTSTVEAAQVNVDGAEVIDSGKTVDTSKDAIEINSAEPAQAKNSAENVENVIDNSAMMDNSKEIPETNSLEPGLVNNNVESAGNNVIAASEMPGVMPQNNDATVNVEDTTQGGGDMVDDNFDTRSIMSDHDYCRSPLPFITTAESITNKVKSNERNGAMTPMSTKARVIPTFVSMRDRRENKSKNLQHSLMGPPAPKRRKLSQKQIDKLITSKINPVKEMKFEKFFSLNYQPQIGEGDVQEVDYESDHEEHIPDQIVSCSNQDGDMDDARSVILEHSYCHLPESDTQLQDADPQLPDTDCQLPDSDQPLLDDSGFEDATVNEPMDVTDREQNREETTSDEGVDEGELLPAVNSTPRRRFGVDPEHEEEYQRLLAEVQEARRELCKELMIDPEREITERQKKELERLAAKARVEKWRETINPILRKLKENDFDIHEYGDRVMDGMEVEETKPFKDIVDGKSSAEVVRYFIASLQLANTYNIEICGAKSGEVSNDTFNVKLLGKHRYHEHLSEYHAPSEESLREKLKRIRELQMNETAEREPPIKRRRLEQPPKRKRKRKQQQSHNDTPSSPPENVQTPRNKSSKGTSDKPPNPDKGKNIVIKLVPTTLPQDCNTPSTSQSSYIHSLPAEEDIFCEELTSVRLRNPEQFSTPQTPRHTRSSEPGGCGSRSIVFS